ncbi:MAG TPA: type II and III secretion system protein [Bryobacteraceae bacterium]|jgi:general secretion pathway protein D|nr:type II and III secretion system protein [Bryobacteraceae bacterium]
MYLRFAARLPISLVVVCAGLLGASEGAKDSARDEAKALARKAKRAEKAGHDSEAFVFYSQAAARLPGDKRYKALMESLRSRADAETGSTASTPDIPTVEAFDSLTAREMAGARRLQGPPVLNAKVGLQDFALNGTARSLFDQVAQRFGLETVYDGDFPATGAQIRFHVDGVDYREALHDLQAATGAFVVPLTSRLLMVAQDTPQKRNDLEQTISITVPIPQAVTTQELTEIGQAVKQATNVDKIAWNTAQSEIVIRDRISRALPAQALLHQLFGSRSDIAIDLEFLEVDDSDLRNYGFNVTNSFDAIYMGQILHNVITAPTGVANLLTFGAGKTLIGIGVAQAQAMFNETLSSAKTLFRIQLRATEGQAATFHSGEKYPIETSAFAGATPTGTTGSVFAPPPAFTYEDLGVSLKLTPHVHGMGEMTLAVETSYELLTGSAVNGLPIIGRRSLNSQVRLRNDEWAVIAGLVNPTDSKSVSGFWGLADIPFFGNLFKQTSTDKANTNVLIAIRPHLLSLPPDQIVTHSLRVGSETRPYNPL